MINSKHRSLKWVFSCKVWGKARTIFLTKGLKSTFQLLLFTKIDIAKLLLSRAFLYASTALSYFPAGLISSCVSSPPDKLPNATPLAGNSWWQLYKFLLFNTSFSLFNFFTKFCSKVFVQLNHTCLFYLQSKENYFELRTSQFISVKRLLLSNATVISN